MRYINLHLTFDNNFFTVLTVSAVVDKSELISQKITVQ